MLVRHGLKEREKDQKLKGMEEKKNDQPKWINGRFSKVLNDILLNKTIKEAISDLEEGKVNQQLVKKSNRLSKNPEEYENENDRESKVVLVIGES
jgi:DNA polymerase elongation subunit (family B)